MAVRRDSGRNHLPRPPAVLRSVFRSRFQRRPASPNGDLLLSAAGAVGGEELWRSDGTPGGTTLVADLRPGDIGSQPMHLRASEQKSSSPPATEPAASLYRSDGTTPGTTAVALPPGASPYPSFGPWAGDGASYYFSGSDAVHGLEPWVFDGLTAQLLADVVPGPTSSLDEDDLQSGLLCDPRRGAGLLGGRRRERRGDLAQRRHRPGRLTALRSRSRSRPDGDRHVGRLAPAVGDRRRALLSSKSRRRTAIASREPDGTTVGPTVIRSIDNQSSAFPAGRRETAAPSSSTVSAAAASLPPARICSSIFRTTRLNGRISGGPTAP